jgi:hypothetical protein
MSANEPSNEDVRQLIIDLRGGVPESCNFCGQKKPPEQLHPDEGGEWICIECIKRLGYQ